MLRDRVRATGEQLNKENKMKSTQTKLGIVSATGSGRTAPASARLILALQAEGHQVIAAQYGLNTTADGRRQRESSAGPGQQPR